MTDLVAGLRGALDIAGIQERVLAGMTAEEKGAAPLPVKPQEHKH